MGKLDRELYNSIRIKGETGEIITPLGEGGREEEECIVLDGRILYECFGEIEEG